MSSVTNLITLSDILYIPSKVKVLISLFTFFQFYSVVRKTAKSTILWDLYFLLIIIGSGRLAEISDPFVSQNPRGACACHSPGHILGCAYTIYSYCQISISCTIPSGLFVKTFQADELQLLSPLFSCSTVFFSSISENLFSFFFIFTLRLFFL